MKKILTTIFFGTIALAVNCQEIMTIGEVFDFNVDDEFHIENLAGPGFPSGYKTTITDKWYSDDNETVNYSITHDMYYTMYNMQTDDYDYHYRSSVDVLQYTNLDSSIYTYHHNARYPTDSTHVFRYDTLIYIDSNLCDAQINGFWRKDGDFEPSTAHFEYGKGLGTTYQLEITDWHGRPDWEYRLVYYLKDGMEFGTPIWRLNNSMNIIGTSANFEVNPTLVQDWISIKASSSEEKYTMRLIDLTGRKLIERTNLYGESSFNLGSIIQGSYIILIQSETNLFTKQIIKE